MLRAVRKALLVLVAPVALIATAAPAAAQTDPVGGLVHQVTQAVNQTLSDAEGVPPVEDGLVRSPIGALVPVVGAPLQPFVAAIFGGSFYCHTNREGSIVVPGGVNAVQITAAGGQGGGDPLGLGRDGGGLGASVTALYSVQPGQTLHVTAACAGNGGGGFGGGGGGWHGRGNVLWLDDGSGGGGASTVFLDSRLLVVAAGGGGGGGATSLGQLAGGRGGDGGAAAPGTPGSYAPGGFPGPGGCGGCSGSLTGGWGLNGSGGGGGGGGGFPGGAGGGGGIGPAAGGGGGGGASYADPWAVGVSSASGTEGGDGYVLISFGTL